MYRLALGINDRDGYAPQIRHQELSLGLLGDLNNPTARDRCKRTRPKADLGRPMEHLHGQGAAQELYCIVLVEVHVLAARLDVRLFGPTLGVGKQPVFERIPDCHSLVSPVDYGT